MSKLKAKKKAAKEPKPKSAKPAKEKKEKKANSKLQIVIDLLKRPEGATNVAIQKATEWQAHTVRGCISGALKKKHGYEIVSEKSKEGDHVYKIKSDGGKA